MSENESEEKPGTTQNIQIDHETRKWTRRRNLSAFWILGLCNNYAYVIMLSAAFDILQEETTAPTKPPPITLHTVDWINLNTSTTPINPYDCNGESTAVILMANIFPSLFIKLTAPWFADLMPYDFKIGICVFMTAASLIIVALAKELPLSLIGVICASAASGLGEFSFLSMATFFDENVVSTWSSGTGAAGLLGSLSYAGLIAAGLSPRITILVMLVVPVVMAFSYWLMLVRVPAIQGCSWGKQPHVEYPPLLEETQDDGQGTDTQDSHLPWREKLAVFKSLIYLIIPLVVVYVAEYFINQGLYELIYFPDAWLTHDAQYRWYQVIYQVGVFISRSSVNILLIQKTWILAVLQIANVVVFLTQLFYFYIPSIFIVFALILFEGLLGGAAYVNTFYIIRREVVAEKREFALGAATVADGTGIALASFIALPTHAAFCRRVVVK